jgi:RimJ/RimL family protein N-acetyltransferase
MTPAPIIETDRLILRGPVLADFEPLALFFADKTRSTGFGGPIPRDQAWRWFATMIGHWHIHGYGFWTVTSRDGGEAMGICGLWYPEGWPETELGWVMFEAAEGKGFAFEAASAVRDHAYGTLGFTTMTSNIVPGNTRSIALAERLGATLERTYENVNMGTEHLYRHPAPKADA